MFFQLYQKSSGHNVNYFTLNNDNRSSVQVYKLEKIKNITAEIPNC